MKRSRSRLRFEVLEKRLALARVDIGTGSSVTTLTVAGYSIYQNNGYSTTSSSSLSVYGFGVEEANMTTSRQVTTESGGSSSTTLGDAFDGALMFGLAPSGTPSDTVYYDTDGMVDITGNTITGDPATEGVDGSFGGLEIWQQNAFLELSPTVPVIRTIASMRNPTGSSITKTVGFFNDLGSDSDTTIFATSSGDTTFSAPADRWVGTFDNYDGPDPRLLHVLQGPGTVTSPYSAEWEGNGDDEPDWIYTVTIGPGETKSLMVFVGLYGSKAQASSDGTSVFNSNATVEAKGLLVGLDDTQRTRILNWSGLPPAPSNDYGDAPDSTAGTGAGDYQTTSANSGPSHTIVAGLFLGDSVDEDDGTLQNARANADDVDGALPDDEDGVLSPLDLRGTEGAQPKVTLQATNTTLSAATLYGWIDYNADGVFDNAGERASIAVPTGTTDGRFTLTFPAIPADSAGATYARFRLSSDAAAAAPTGAADDGEVEDYAFTIVKPADVPVDSFVKIANGSGGLAAGLLDQNDGFGPVAALGDLDGDGVPDMAVGVYGDDQAASDLGAVYVLLMNADGTVKTTQKITNGVGGLPAGSVSIYDRFGESIAAVGDLDGDGVPDLAVGATMDDTGGTNLGAVHVLLMKSDGTVKSNAKIASGLNGGPTLAPYNGFSISLGALGDVDGDGVPDLAVGAQGDSTGRGAVYLLLMKPDGTAKSNIKIASGTNGGPTLSAWEHFGASVASLGDLDGDGVADLAVGASGADSYKGAVYVLLMNSNGTARTAVKIGDGQSGLPAGTLSTYDLFGVAVAGLGDLDGDGVSDLAVGSKEYAGGERRGALYVLRMKSDGTVDSSVKIADGSNDCPPLVTYEWFGGSAALLGDLDADGLPELAVGANGFDTWRGAVYVLSLSAPSSSTTTAVLDAGVLTVADTADRDDAFRVVRNGDNLEITSTGATFDLTGATGATPITGGFSIAAADVDSLVLNAAGGDDTLTADFTGGNPLPAGGVEFDGGTDGSDALVLQNGTFPSVTHSLTNANDGVVTLNDGTADFTLEYAGLEPITDSLAATDRVFTFNGDANAIVLSDDGTAEDGINRIASDASETVDFVNPTGTLTINTGAGADSVTAAAALDDDGGTGVTFDLVINGADAGAGTAAVSLTGYTAAGAGVEIYDGAAVVLNTVSLTGNDAACGLYVERAASLSDTDGTYSENDDNGIYLSDISGNVTLVRTTLENNDADNDAAGDGLHAADGTDSGTVAIGGNLLVQGATIRRTGDGHQAFGLYVADGIGGSVTFESSTGTVRAMTVTGNERDGITVIDGTTAGLTGGDYSNNAENGIDVGSFSGAVTVTAVTANGNGLTTDCTGLYIDGAGSVAISGTGGGSFNGNGWDGIGVFNVSGAVTLTDVTAEDNADAGVDLEGVGSLTVSGGSFSANGTNGGDVYDVAGAVQITNATFDDNGLADEYTGLYILTAGSVAISGTGGGSFNGNGWDGIGVFDVTGAVTLTDVTANANEDDNVDVEDSGTLTVTGGQFDEAGDIGVEVWDVTEVILTGLSGDGQGVSWSILDIQSDDAMDVTISNVTVTDCVDDNIYVWTSGDVSLTAVTSTASGDDNADIEQANSLTVTGGSFNNGNGVGESYGLDLEGIGTVTLTDWTATGNDLGGVYLDSVGSATLEFTDAADDAFTLSGAAVEVTHGASVLDDVAFRDLTSLAVNGGGGDDLLTVDLSAGFPDLSGGLTFDGQGQTLGDALAVLGNGTANTAVYTPDATTPGVGTVVADEDGTETTTLTIVFTGLEPVDLEGLATATLQLPGGADAITLTNGTTSVGGAAIVASGTSGGTAIESVAFRDNGTVVIDTATGGCDEADTITIASANNDHGNTNLTISTGSDLDEVNVDGNATVTGTLSITTAGAIVDGGGTLAAASAKLDSGMGVGTAADHPIQTDVGTLAARAAASGGVYIDEAGDLAIGTVGGLAGIVSADDVVLDATSVSPAVAGDDVTLAAGKTLSFAAGTELQIGFVGDAADPGLTVVGNVDLTGVVLALQGTHTPAAGLPVAIVTASGTLSGRFTGLDEGGTVAFDSTVLVADYAAASVTLTELVDVPPTVEAVQINDGSAQRSMVTQLVVTFSTVVALDAAAFEVLKVGGALVGLDVADMDNSSGQTVVTLTFTGAGTEHGSLADGNYELTVLAATVHTQGHTLDGDKNGTEGDNYKFGAAAVDKFFRFFGDGNGDRLVNTTDLAAFRTALGKSEGQSGYQWYFDLDEDGVVDATEDYAAFLARYRARYLAPAGGRPTIAVVR